MGWGCENEGLGEADQDLAEHDDAVLGWRGASAGIAYPIAAENEEGGGDECEAWTARMECIDRGW